MTLKIFCRRDLARLSSQVAANKKKKVGLRKGWKEDQSNLVPAICFHHVAPPCSALIAGVK